MAEQLKCDVCGNPYSASYLPNHKRTAHGIYGGRTGITRKRKQVGAVVVAKKANKKKIHAQPGTLTPLPARLYVDETGQMWIAEPFGGRQ